MTLIREGWMALVGCGVAAIAIPWWILGSSQSDALIPEPVVPPGLSIRPVLGIASVDVEGLFAFSALQLEGGEAEGEGAVSGQTQSYPRLVGVVLPAAGKPVVLAVGADGETSLLRPGEEIDGWQLVSVGADTGTFLRNGTRTVVHLDYSNRSSSPSGAGAPSSLPSEAPIPAQETQ